MYLMTLQAQLKLQPALILTQLRHIRHISITEVATFLNLEEGPSLQQM
jgi:hypothetical protein